MFTYLHTMYFDQLLRTHNFQMRTIQAKRTVSIKSDSSKVKPGQGFRGSWIKKKNKA
jgi:hypothetical protein